MIESNGLSRMSSVSVLCSRNKWCNCPEGRTSEEIATEKQSTRSESTRTVYCTVFERYCTISNALSTSRSTATSRGANDLLAFSCGRIDRCFTMPASSANSMQSDAKECESLGNFFMTFLQYSYVVFNKYRMGYAYAMNLCSSGNISSSDDPTVWYSCSLCSPLLAGHLHLKLICLKHIY